MKSNFRMIFLKRKLKQEDKYISEYFRVRINNCIPPSHKDFQSCEF